MPDDPVDRAAPEAPPRVFGNSVGEAAGLPAGAVKRVTAHARRGDVAHAAPCAGHHLLRQPVQVAGRLQPGKLL